MALKIVGNDTKGLLFILFCLQVSASAALIRWDDLDSLERKAQAGDADAQYTLGWVLKNGWEKPHVQADNDKAEKWLKKAFEGSRKEAGKGDVKAQVRLAGMYAGGLGAAKDLKEAEKWYRKAAEKGDADAQFNLGYILCEGALLGSKEADSGFVWLKRAAEQGQSGAQLELGRRYRDGKGTVQDFTEAVKWYRAAARAGNPMAYGPLGKMYALGHGVERDLMEAYVWLNVAAATFPFWEDISKDRDFIMKQLTSAQIAEAQRRANEFVSRQSKVKNGNVEK